eukprot:1452651-Pyramimonas_sp.AAC.1
MGSSTLFDLTSGSAPALNEEAPRNELPEVPRMAFELAEFRQGPFQGLHIATDGSARKDLE